jgi:hypothetical protein
MTTIARPQRISGTNARRRRFVGVAGAVLVAALIWIITVPLAGHHLRIGDGSSSSTQTVDLPAVIVVSLGVSLLAWGLLALLERFTRRARLIWVVVASLVLLASLVPLTAPSLDGATRVALGLMHLSVGAILLTTYVSSSSPRRT